MLYRPDEPDPAKVVWRYTPTAEERADVYADCAEEYAVELRPDVPGGVIIYAMYHGKWVVNAQSVRTMVRKMLEQTSELRSSEEICEALTRHVEMSGSEVFEKNFVKEGNVVCSVWCIIGPNAEAFCRAARKYLEDQGFKED